MLNIWIGENYYTSSHRILVLGESWYDEEESLTKYIGAWADGEQRDATFSRIFNAGSDFHTSRAKPEKRLEFWNSIAFYNFVVGTVGPTRKHRPTQEHYEHSKPDLEIVLATYKPNGVWILGKGQAEYSEPVMAASGIPFQTVAHPTSYGLRSDILKDSWNSLITKISASSLEPVA